MVRRVFREYVDGRTPRENRAQVAAALAIDQERFRAAERSHEPNTTPAVLAAPLAGAESRRPADFLFIDKSNTRQLLHILPS
jgi:hypothetical protein